MSLSNKQYLVITCQAFPQQNFAQPAATATLTPAPQATTVPPTAYYGSYYWNGKSFCVNFFFAGYSFVSSPQWLEYVAIPWVLDMVVIWVKEQLDRKLSNLVMSCLRLMDSGFYPLFIRCLLFSTWIYHTFGFNVLGCREKNLVISSVFVGVILYLLGAWYSGTLKCESRFTAFLLSSEEGHSPASPWCLLGDIFNLNERLTLISGENNGSLAQMPLFWLIFQILPPWICVKILSTMI